MKKITLDFETRSEADLKSVGAWMYSRHPSTDVMCLGWSDGTDRGQWRMGDAPPKELFLRLLFPRAYVAVAHNAFFEYCIWLNVCHEKYGWITMPDDMWRCSASKAASCSLPRGLADAGKALNLKVVKEETEGSWAMKKMSKPCRPTKNDASSPWHESEDDWQKMLAYNTNDVDAEEELDAALPDLSPRELAIWQMTERINRRGLGIDVKGCEAAVKIAGAHAAQLTKEFQSITGLESAGQRAKFTVWLAANGVTIPNTQADTLDALLRDQATRPHVRHAVGIVRALGRSSIKKYRAMLNMADTDGRARGTLIYCGAQRTGRWSGSGLQPHNFKREGPPDMDLAWDDIHTGDLEWVKMIYGDPLEFLSRAVRGALWAPPGRQLYSGDFAQIEVRKLFWLSGEKAGLDTFRRGEDMYCDMALMIFNRKVTKADSEKRFLGKQATLALGFGAGYIKFLIHCLDLGAPLFTWAQVCDAVPAADRVDILNWIMREDYKNVVKRMKLAGYPYDMPVLRALVLAKYVVNRYRTRYKNTVVKFWHDLENAVRAALGSPGREFRAGKVSYVMGKKFLNCRLPSGRVMRYFEPEISEAGDVTYMNMEEGQWVRVKTYGGKLAENATQASARDIEAEALLRLEDSPYRDIVMTVHDDATSETDAGVGSVEEFAGIMSQSPTWCPDIPIKVDAWVGRRYHK